MIPSPVHPWLTDAMDQTGYPWSIWDRVNGQWTQRGGVCDKRAHVWTILMDRGMSYVEATQVTGGSTHATVHRAVNKLSPRPVRKVRRPSPVAIKPKPGHRIGARRGKYRKYKDYHDLSITGDELQDRIRLSKWRKWLDGKMEEVKSRIAAADRRRTRPAYAIRRSA